MSVRKMPRLLAMYLPQFHPIPENDEWWGKGFTEWTNVVKAQPLFPGHYQPHLPSELGFYDLRVAETRTAQAALARAHGIHGFCYYHYWFQGRLLLERPLREVLETGEPDFPFCMCWANENWTRGWDGGSHQILMPQRYSEEDDVAHIRWLIPYMKDPRYIKVNGKPMFLIYRAGHIDRLSEMTRVFRAEAMKAGFPGLYLGRMESHGEEGDLSSQGIDAGIEFQPRSGNAGAFKPVWLRGRFRALAPAVYQKNRIREYRRLVWGALNRPRAKYKRYPGVTPSWDNTSRRAPKSMAHVWVSSTPEIYEHWLRETLRRFRPYGPEEDFVFINAWNEWAEGNHLEPDQKWGRGYLEATRRALEATNGQSGDGVPEAETP